jgi:hypothetical protein
VLADQNFPALLPVHTSQQCLKILRIESASLQDLEEEFNRGIGNRRIMPSSLILVLSPAHLSNVGLAAYIHNFTNMSSSQVRRPDRDVKVGPLPPFMLAGCHHRTVVHKVFEFIAWANSYYEHCDFYMEAMFEAAKNIKMETGFGQQLYLKVKRMRLPASYKNGGSMLWHSDSNVEGNSKKLPCTIPPLLQPKEEKLVITLLEELRSNLALDLDTSPSFERGLGPE